MTRRQKEGFSEGMRRVERKRARERKKHRNTDIKQVRYIERNTEAKRQIVKNKQEKKR